VEAFPSEIVVGEGEGGVRVDLYLRERLTGATRALLRREIDAGHVLRNGRPVRKGDLLAPGDRLDLRLFHIESDSRIAPDAASPLVVLYEDPDILVVEKETGLPTLPRDSSDTRALACRLVARRPELAAIGPPHEAGLLHRLDTETSGILVAARTREAYAGLRDQWRWKRVTKAYLALVEGEARGSFTMLVPVGHHPKSGKRMVAGGGGRSAETRFRSLSGSARVSLLVANLREGRRHQIRVHLATAGHPILGDRLYARDSKERAPRLMLHAWRLRFRVRPEDDPIEVACPPPADFVKAVEKALGGPGARALDRAVRSAPAGRLP